MHEETVDLWDRPTAEGAAEEIVSNDRKNGVNSRHIRQISNPRLRVFLPEKPDSNRPAVIICPGGGYHLLAMDKEGDDVARLLAKNGVAAFVLIYRMPDPADPQPVPLPVLDIRQAIRLLRFSPSRWNINADLIGVMGFSAGGHLASVAVTRFNDDDKLPSVRPNFGLLIYPVISMHDPAAHGGSRCNLLGKNPSIELADRYSADQHITSQTPPLFVVHAQDDGAVPIKNSLQIVDAAKKAGIPVEFIHLQTGDHGFGLGVNGGEPTIWPPRCIQWMRTNHILAS